MLLAAAMVVLVVLLMVPPSPTGLALEGAVLELTRQAGPRNDHAPRASGKWATGPPARATSHQEALNGGRGKRRPASGSNRRRVAAELTTGEVMAVAVAVLALAVVVVMAALSAAERPRTTGMTGVGVGTGRQTRLLLTSNGHFEANNPHQLQPRGRALDRGGLVAVAVVAAMVVVVVVVVVRMVGLTTKAS